MAEIRLKDNGELKKARRMMRRCGIRLTVRNGRIYTVKAVAIVQPKTEKQLKNWAIFTEANKLTDRDLKELGRKRYWKRRAKEQGYKTARGCAKAYYIKMVKEGRTEEKKSDMEMIGIMKRGWTSRRREKKKRPVWDNATEEIERDIGSEVGELATIIYT